MWCWIRLWRVLWTAILSQSTLKEINSEYPLAGLMLKLKFPYFGYLIWGADSLEKALMLRKTEGKRRREWQRMRWLYSIIDSMHMNLSKLWEIVEDRGAWCAVVHGVANIWTQLCNWTTTKSCSPGLSGSEVKASACSAGDLGSISGSGRSPGEGNGNPFQYSCLENPMDGGAWWATVHGVAKSRTRLSDWTELNWRYIALRVY